MYVPGNDDRKLAKIPSLGADCICLDCEDGVAANMKEVARTNIRNILDTSRIEFGKVLLLQTVVSYIYYWAASDRVRRLIGSKIRASVV